MASPRKNARDVASTTCEAASVAFFASVVSRTFAHAGSDFFHRGVSSHQR